MKCPKCLIEMAESKYFNYDEDDLFRQKYFCFDCNTLYECTSQSADMVEEYLEEIGTI